MSQEARGGIEVEQLLVLGRGIEEASDPAPGTLMFDSEHSGDTYDRVLAAHFYSTEHPEVDTILLSGGITFAMPPEQRPGDRTEADAMLDMLLNLNTTEASVDILVDPFANSTYANVIGAARLLNPDKVVGVAVHDDHKERAMKIIKRVMPEFVVVPIPADNPERKNRKATQGLNDKIANAVYTVAMFGVEDGDLYAFNMRDEKVQHVGAKVLGYARQAKELPSELVWTVRILSRMVRPLPIGDV